MDSTCQVLYLYLMTKYVFLSNKQWEMPKNLHRFHVKHAFLVRNGLNTNTVAGNNSIINVQAKLNMLQEFWLKNYVLHL